MADIKIKERKQGTIKKFDKATNFTKKLKVLNLPLKKLQNKMNSASELFQLWFFHPCA